MKRHSRMQSYGAFIVLSSLPLTVMAEMLDEVVVTGSRVEESAFETPQSVSTVKREEILERNYRTTPESLAYTTGVLVQKTAHGQGSPFIRGLTGKQVLILVDGVRLNNSTFRFGPNQYLATIDPAIIDRIEVVRGPGSVLYGSDALGGVINVITRKRKDFSEPSKHGGEANLAAGSADKERTARVAGEGNVETFGYWVGGDYRVFDDLEGGGDVGVQPYTGYNEYHANSVLSLKPGKDKRLDFSVQYTRQNDLPRTDKYVNNDESRIYNPQERQFYSLQWNGAMHAALADRLRAGISYQLMHEALERKKVNDPSWGVRNYDDKVGTVGLTLQLDKAIGSKNLLTYGLEHYRDEVKSWRVDTKGGTSTDKRGNFPDGSKYNTTGLYLQDEYFVSDKSAFTLGIRYSLSQAKTTLEDYGDLDETYDDVTGSLRWSGEVQRGMRLFAGIAQGFRAPNLDDIAVLKNTNEGEDVPSPGLKPEKSINYELGMKMNRAAWQGTMTAFYSDYSDLIDRRRSTYKGLDFIDENGNGVRDPGEPNVVQKFNVGDAYIYGIEMDSRVVFNRDWSAFGNFAWMYGQNETDNEPLSRIPPMRLILGVRWEMPASSWWVEPLAEFNDRQDRLSSRDIRDPRIPDGGTPGYALFNLRGGWHDRRQRVDIALNNLTDREYKVHGSGLYGPGREIKISYLLNF